MKAQTQKAIGWYFLLIIFGVSINRSISMLATELGLPLYLDSIGTMFVAALGGITPGMVVGFSTNMIGGISDSTTFYYGTINVLIALIVGYAANNGRFDKIYKVLKLIPYYMLLSIPCSFISFVLYNGKIAEIPSKPAVVMLHDLGLPVIISQIIGDFCIEIPDKLVSLIFAFFLFKIFPESWKSDIQRFSNKDRNGTKNSDIRTNSTLKKHIGMILIISGLAVTAVAFIISYKTYMEVTIDSLEDEVFVMNDLRIEALMYSGKMLSALIGILFCIISFSIVMANRVIVTPLVNMTREMRRFVYDNSEGRDESVDKIRKLDIHTGNEIEDLYLALLKSVKDIDDYISKTNEQSKTISDLHINIITTLADIVESRDETTGNHVKRTAEYTTILADKLRAKGFYTDTITDDFVAVLAIAAPLHDIGKIKIPDAILNKPGKLTDEEFDIIKTHTTLGADMLDDAVNTMGSTQYLTMARNIALYHHEWWNGCKRGYPKGLSGEDIPLCARIMAVADVLDALLSKRPYKDGYSLEKAFEIMKEESGTHFDPVIIDAMLECKKQIKDVLVMYAD